MPNPQEHFVARLSEIAEQYILTKEIVIFLERYNKNGDSYIGPHNEVRNAFDHVMKMVICTSDADAVEKQYSSAKSHLLRAGYDAYELLCSSSIKYIYTALESFSPSDISKGFPDYYQKGMRADITKIQEALAHYRVQHPAVNKIQDIDKHEAESVHKADEVEKGQRLYSYYQKSADQLRNYCSDVDAHLPAMSEFKNERLKKERNAKLARIKVMPEIKIHTMDNTGQIEIRVSGTNGNIELNPAHNPNRSKTLLGS
jgi:hypothetical protein